MCTRFEAIGEQGKELTALAQKAANDTRRADHALLDYLIALFGSPK
jgi:hypothetical protein